MLNLRIVPDIVDKQTIYGLAPSQPVLDAANMMAKYDISAVVVLGENGKLLGIVTERDLTRRVLADGLDPVETLVEDVMTENPDTLSPDDAAIDALELMRTRRYRHLPIVQDGQVIGILSVRDLYDAVQDSLEQSMRETEAFAFGEDKGV